MQKHPSDQVWKTDNRQINRSNFTSGKVPKTYKSEERLSTQAAVYIVAVNEESQLYDSHLSQNELICEIFLYQWIFFNSVCLLKKKRKR